MSFTSATVEVLIRAGGKLSIDASGYTGQSLEVFVRAAKAKNVAITLRNASSKTSATVENLIRIGADLTIEI